MSRCVDVMLRDADRHAAERGRLAARDAWVEQRVEKILTDDDLCEDVMEMFVDCEAYELEREVAIQAARLGASAEATRLRELLRAGAEAMARAELRDRG